jgi:hypothetical protein
MPLIHEERYWQRACEEGQGWRNVDIAQHGLSWKQVRQRHRERERVGAGLQAVEHADCS